MTTARARKRKGKQQTVRCDTRNPEGHFSQIAAQPNLKHLILEVNICLGRRLASIGWSGVMDQKATKISDRPDRHFTTSDGSDAPTGSDAGHSARFQDPLLMQDLLSWQDLPF